MTLEGKLRPSGTPADSRTLEAVGAVLVEGKLPCARAHAVARELGMTPKAVGEAADQLGVRLARCQLGFFGYPNKKGFDSSDAATRPVPEGLAEAIEASRNEAGDVACATLWEIAAQFRVPRMLVGYVADQHCIHVTPCQLGAF